MRAPTQAELLALWEAGRSLEALDRGALAASVASGSEDAADWPLGKRNRALAQLHCTAFGGRLQGWTSCPECSERLEFTFDGRAVANAPPAERSLVAVNEWRFRLPTSRDLADAAEEESDLAASRRLLVACWAGSGPAPADWSEEDLSLVGERLAEADPLSEIRLHFDCPSCPASFDESLDLGDFVWAKVESHAKRLLGEVHSLASAYGWSEAEILALSPARRGAYLDLARP